MYPACALHRKSNSLFIIGGYKNGLWVSHCTKISFTQSPQIKSIVPMDQALMGPVAVIPEQDNPTAILYVSGWSLNDLNQTLIMKYTDDEKKGWKDFFTIHNYPFSFTGLIALPSPII